jgi:hypothetical protein
VNPVCQSNAANKAMSSETDGQFVAANGAGIRRGFEHVVILIRNRMLMKDMLAIY